KIYKRLDDDRYPKNGRQHRQMFRLPNQPEESTCFAGPCRLFLIDSARDPGARCFACYKLKNENGETHEPHTPKQQIWCAKPVSPETGKASSEGSPQHSARSDQRKQSLRLASIEDMVCQQPELRSGKDSEDADPNVKDIKHPGTRAV